ncbi:mechanosensitive ion channel family protein [Candidatus Parcubacteria bacterium]|nr:mechanosensitive ion channel family protein [Candidatus Parcubacteria bacterium]
MEIKFLFTQEHILALGVFVATVIALKIFKHFIIAKLKKLAEKTSTELDDLLIKIIENIGWSFYFFLPLYIASQFIQVPEFIAAVLYYAVFISVAYYVIKGCQDLIDYGAKKIILEKRKEEAGVDTGVIDILTKVLKGALWGVAVVIILSNFGYDVSALIAGLGIGGIAIAFALQNILVDIFSSVSIYFDKPFQVGDFIIVGTDMGVVKKIGIKSTRLQTLQGEELVVSNKELTEARIHNYKKMEKRRIIFGFGVTYEISTEKLKRIPNIIKEIIAKAELAEIDRVHFKEFGDSSLNFEIVYYLNSSNYVDYMNTQQEMNFAIKERFEQEGIEMAYPTQTIFLNKTQ